MFSKQTKPQPASSGMMSDLPALTDSGPGGRKSSSPRVASLIADDVTIEGNITGEGELHIDGVVRGDVRVSRLSVGETGHVEGAIQAEVLEARGRIVGSITAKQVRLFSTCYVDGDITHEQLMMEAGAFFQGRSLKFQRPAAPAPTPVELVDLNEPPPHTAVG
jgi:cytoskeletal protein CcmA (bactofilin family)